MTWFLSCYFYHRTHEFLLTIDLSHGEKSAFARNENQPNRNVFELHYGTKKLRTPKDFLKSNTNIK